MRGRLTEEQREQIARSAHERYEAGQTWEQIARDHDLHPGTVRRLVMERHPVTFRRWGQRPVVDAEAGAALRERGASIQRIAEKLGCSRTAVRTALERTSGAPSTRYPRLSARRDPTEAELQELQRLYTACPEAPRSRPGHRDTRGEAGAALAEACLAVVEDGVPMQTLSLALDRGPTWVHWLLGRHDCLPEARASRSTSRKTRD